MEEEDMIVWQDILDLLMAGRAEDINCPFCHRSVLQVTHTQRGTTRLECSTCRKFIEGQLNTDT